MLLFPTNFSNGFMLNMDNRTTFEGEGGSFIIGPNAFGHVGYGGSSATFVDPDFKISNVTYNRKFKIFIKQECILCSK